MPGKPSNITAQIPTPFLLIEEKIVRNNIKRINDYAGRYGFSVRTHVKTHKSIAIARMQIDAEAVGIAVAKADEARVMANIWDVDITVAYPIERRAQKALPGYLWTGLSVLRPIPSTLWVAFRMQRQGMKPL